jgi:hypothetical protein
VHELDDEMNKNSEVMEFRCVEAKLKWIPEDKFLVPYWGIKSTLAHG